MAVASKSSSHGVISDTEAASDIVTSLTSGGVMSQGVTSVKIVTSARQPQVHVTSSAGAKIVKYRLPSEEVLKISMPSKNNV